MDSTMTAIPATACSAPSDLKPLEPALLSAVKQAACHDIYKNGKVSKGMSSWPQKLETVLQPHVACVHTCMPQALAYSPNGEQESAGPQSPGMKNQRQEAASEGQTPTTLPDSAELTTYGPDTSASLTKAEKEDIPQAGKASENVAQAKAEKENVPQAEAEKGSIAQADTAKETVPEVDIGEENVSKARAEKENIPQAEAEEETVPYPEAERENDQQTAEGVALQPETGRELIPKSKEAKEIVSHAAAKEEHVPEAGAQKGHGTHYESAIHQGNMECDTDRQQLHRKQKNSGRDAVATRISSQDPARMNHACLPAGSGSACDTAELLAQNSPASRARLAVSPSPCGIALPQTKGPNPAKGTGCLQLPSKAVASRSSTSRAATIRPTKMGRVDVWPIVVSDEQLAMLEVLIADVERLQCASVILAAQRVSTCSCPLWDPTCILFKGLVTVKMILLEIKYDESRTGSFHPHHGLFRLMLR
jgi:hypothetical protein